MKELERGKILDTGMSLNIKNSISVMEKLHKCKQVIHIFAHIDKPEQDRHFLILDYAENGKILDHLESGIKECKNLAMETKQRILYDLVLALEFMHNLNIVHNELRLEKILLDEKFHVKVSNFLKAKTLNKFEKEDVLNAYESFSEKYLDSDDEDLDSPDFN